MPHVTRNGTPCIDLFALNANEGYRNGYLQRTEGTRTYHLCWIGPAPFREEWVNVMNITNRKG